MDNEKNKITDALTIKIWESSNEPGFFYNIYNTDEPEHNQALEIDGGLCTGTIADALVMACDQAHGLIAKNALAEPVEPREGYNIVDREDEIENLIRYISETRSDSDKELMKQDLKELMSWNCRRVYSSEDINEYLPIID